jgi:SAM-dependent methyltransferase
MKVRAQLVQGVQRAFNGAGFRIERLLPAEHDEPLYAAYDSAVLRRRPFINIGAGAFSHRYWTNVDHASDAYARVQHAAFVEHDLTKLGPLPFETGSIELAYTSHTIEHVNDAAVEQLFRECFRVLRPGGGFRVTCPDARAFYQTIVDDNLPFWSFRRRWFAGPGSNAPRLDDVTVFDFFVREVATRRCRYYVHAQKPPSLAELEERFRTLDYAGFVSSLTGDLVFDPNRPEHMNAWDEARVTDKLRSAGFSDVYVSRRGQSRFAPMMDPVCFDSTMPWGSLFVEARR